MRFCLFVLNFKLLLHFQNHTVILNNWLILKVEAVSEKGAETWYPGYKMCKTQRLGKQAQLNVNKHEISTYLKRNVNYHKLI